MVVFSLFVLRFLVLVGMVLCSVVSVCNLLVLVCCGVGLVCFVVCLLCVCVVLVRCYIAFKRVGWLCLMLSLRAGLWCVGLLWVAAGCGRFSGFRLCCLCGYADW